jgi:hypothetical protein
MVGLHSIMILNAAVYPVLLNPENWDTACSMRRLAAGWQLLGTFQRPG